MADFDLDTGTAASAIAGANKSPVDQGGVWRAATFTQIATFVRSLIVAADITNLASGIATFLTTPSSANLATAVTDETGSGALVFNDTPALTDPTITNYTEELYEPPPGASLVVALTNGTVQKLTTTANATVTLPASASGKSYVVMIAYGGVHTLTWAGGGTLLWASGTAPTATSVNGKTDIFTFFCDGTNTYGAVMGQNF